MNRGICIQPIPSARMTAIVVRKLIPVSVDDATSIICPATHIVTPECAPALTTYGAYPVQPVSAPWPEKTPVKMSKAANGCSQNERALILGRARSGAPICSGTIQLAKPLISGIAARKIIVVPCSVKNWLYWSCEMKPISGPASCKRIIIARIPPIPRKNMP